MAELAGILVVGIFAQWLAWKLKIPAILPLIVLGITVGPFSTFLLGDRVQMIDTTELFSSEIFFDVVSLSVGIILFEGGLTLRFKEVKKHLKTIRNLLFLGSTVTLLGGAFSAYYFLDLSLEIAFLFGALVIVTGPTVIRPILQNVKPSKNIATILKWEGVLIDPVGAFVTVLIYEFIIARGTTGTFSALTGFFMTILSGIAVGTLMAYFTFILLKKNWAPHFLKNTVVLALCVFAYALSDYFHEESGLLAVTIMGIVISNSGLKDVKSLLAFKEDITTILISVLFIALSSRISMEDIQMIGWESLLVLVVLIFVIRPVSVFLSSMRSKELTLNEKIFISYISPRGIVSAGIASVFALKISSGGVTGLSDDFVRDAQLLLPLTFLVILGTVILQGGTAKFVAKLLGVQRKKEKGIIFVGANPITRFLAKILSRKKIPVLLADTSLSNIKETKMQGLQTYHGSVLTDEDFIEDISLGYGQLMAITANTEINQLSSQLMKEEFGKYWTYRVPSTKEKELEDFSIPKHVLFNDAVDYYTLLDVIQDRPQVHVKYFESTEALRKFVYPGVTEVIPLFLEDELGYFYPFSGFLDKQLTEGNLYFVYKNESSQINSFDKKEFNATPE